MPEPKPTTPEPTPPAPAVSDAAKEFLTAFMADRGTPNLKYAGPKPVPIESEPAAEPPAAAKPDPQTTPPPAAEPPPPAEPPKPVEPPLAEPPAAEPPKEPEPPAEPPKKEEPKAPAEPPWAKDIEDLKAAAEEIRNQTRPAAPAPAATDQLTIDEQRHLEVFRHMEEMDPAAKGISHRFETYVRNLRPYRAKWEAEHPGEEWDGESEEHEAFMARHLPKYDDDQFEEAKTDLLVEKRIKQRERLREEEESKKNLPKRIEQSTNEAIQLMVRTASPELADAIAKHDQEAITKADPDLVELLDDKIHELKMWVNELEKFSDPKLNYQIMPGNALHDQIGLFLNQMETNIAALPSDQQVRDGKRFVTIDQWVRIPEAKRSAYWCLRFDDLRYAKAQQLAKHAKGMVEKRKLRNSPKKESAPKPGPITPTPTPPKPNSDNPKPPVPSPTPVTGLLKPEGVSTGSEKTLGRLIADDR